MQQWPNMMQSVNGEEAVRNYLQFLEDPSKLVDAGALANLETRLAQVTDPVEQLRVLAEIDRITTVDGSGYEDSFIRHAREWAASEGIPGSAFRHLGVTEDVLVRAGLADGARARSRRNRAVPRATRTTRARRSGRTSSDAITAWVVASSAPFTLADVQRGAGGSPATIKKSVDELIATGRVESLGPSSGNGTRGRAPNRYRSVG